MRRDLQIDIRTFCLQASRKRAVYVYDDPLIQLVKEGPHNLDDGRDILGRRPIAGAPELPMEILEPVLAE
jgi:hypothetical protein